MAGIIVQQIVYNYGIFVCNIARNMSAVIALRMQMPAKGPKIKTKKIYICDLPSMCQCYHRTSVEPASKGTGNTYKCWHLFACAATTNACIKFKLTPTKGVYWEGWKMALVAEVRKPQPPEPRSQILYKVDVQRAE